MAKNDAKTYPALTLTRLRQVHKLTTIAGVDKDYLPLVPIIHDHLEYHLDCDIEGLKTLRLMMQKIHL
jgi:hypothetical protein